MKSVPSIQKFKSRKEWEEYVWKKIIEGLAKTNFEEKINKSLDLLLSKYDRKKMINRAVTISFLKQGKSYREIGRMLWLSPTTISAISKSMRAGNEYVSRYTRNKKHEKKQKPLTKEEIKALEFDLWIKAIFTLPEPPLRHPRLMRQLGYRTRFSK